MPTQEISTTQDAARKSQRGGRALESLETLSSFFNGAVVVLTAFLAVAGFFAWKYSSELGALKDETLTRFKIESSKEIAAANERASLAEERAAEAKLALEKYREPRRPTDKQLDLLIERIKPFKGTKFDVGHNPDDREQLNFLWYLEPAIPRAGWIRIDWKGGDMFRMNGWPGNHISGSASVINVSIEVHPVNLEKLKPAAEALAGALKEIGIEATTGDFNNNSMNADAIHILVGQKR